VKSFSGGTLASADSSAVDPTATPTPKERRLLQRLRHRLAYFFVVGLFAASRLLPETICIAFGRAVGALVHRLAGKARRLTADQLEQRLGVDRPRADALAREVFLHMGTNLGEWLVLSRWRRRYDEIVEYDPDEMAMVTSEYQRGKGTIVATAHFGNFELLAQWLANFGYSVNVVSTKLISPEVTALQARWRHAGLVRTIYRGRSNLIKAILRIFKRGEGMGVMVDIDTKAPSVFVPFFGELAKTPRTPADLALRTGASLIFGYSLRSGPRRHRIHMQKIEVEKTGDREADALRITADMTRILEAAVREHPEQWVWMHKRWKSRPEAEQAAAAQ